MTNTFQALGIAQAFYKATAPQVKRDGDGLRSQADAELLEMYQNDGVSRIDLTLPDGSKFGTYSGKMSEPKPPQMGEELRVTDRDAWAAWVAGNAELIAQWLIDDDGAARQAAGYAFTAAGEQPGGCEFVEYVATPGDPGGRWRTTLRIDDAAVMRWAAAQIAEGKNPLALPGADDAQE